MTWDPHYTKQRILGDVLSALNRATSRHEDVMEHYPPVLTDDQIHAISDETTPSPASRISFASSRSPPTFRAPAPPR